MSLYVNLKSDAYKILHMPFWLIHLIIPLVGSGIFLAYYLISPWNEIEKFSAFIEALSAVFPVLIGIITAASTEVEQKAGNFQAILMTSGAKVTPHISKVILLVLSGAFSSVLALATFGIGFMQMGHQTFSFVSYIITALLLLLSVVPLYLLQYIVSFCFGKGYSIGLGLIGSLLSALFLTGLGDGIWFVIPWGIEARLAEYLLVSRLENVPFLQYDGIMLSILVLVVIILILLFFFVLIFGTWEGRKSED